MSPLSFHFRCRSASFVGYCCSVGYGGFRAGIVSGAGSRHGDRPERGGRGQRSVTITNDATNISQTSKSDDHGQFFFTGLRPADLHDKGRSVRLPHHQKRRM